MSVSGAETRGGESTRAGKEGGKYLGKLSERGEQEGVVLEAAGGGVSGGRVVEEAESEMGEQDGWMGGGGGGGPRQEVWICNVASKYLRHSLMPPLPMIWVHNSISQL